MKKTTKEKIIIYNNKPHIVLKELKSYDPYSDDLKTPDKNKNTKIYECLSKNEKKLIKIEAVLLQDPENGEDNDRFLIEHEHPSGDIGLMYGEGTSVTYYNSLGKEHKEDGPSYHCGDETCSCAHYKINGKEYKKEKSYQKALEKFKENLKRS